MSTVAVLAFYLNNFREPFWFDRQPATDLVQAATSANRAGNFAAGSSTAEDDAPLRLPLHFGLLIFPSFVNVCLP